MTTSAIPEDLAAAAEQARQQAEAARERATGLRAQAEAMVTTAEQEAARITSEARTEALAVVADATAADREAAALEEHGRLLAHADGQQAQAKEAARHANDLISEAEQIASHAKEVDGRLGRLDAHRQEVDGQLADAREDADIDLITSLRARLGSLDEAIAALGTQRKQAQGRLNAIGTGEDRGELRAALGAAREHEDEATKTLDQAFPDRPGAADRRTLQEAVQTVKANMTPGGLLDGLRDLPEPWRALGAQLGQQ